MQFTATAFVFYYSGNPSPVEDKSSGKILLVFCRENKDVLTLESSDDGLTWGNMADITTMVRQPTWSLIGTGPPGGLQLPSGRLIICMSTRTLH